MQLRSNSITESRETQREKGKRKHPRQRGPRDSQHDLQADRVDEPPLSILRDQWDDPMCFDFLCGAAISPVQDDDECEAHAFSGGIRSYWCSGLWYNHIFW